MTTTVHQPEPFLVIYHNWKHDPNQAQEIIMGKRENSEHLIDSSFCLGRMLLHVSNIWKELTSKPSSSVTEPENCISWVFTLRSGHNKENVINVISATRVESHPEISFPPALTHDGAARPAGSSRHYMTTVVVGDPLSAISLQKTQFKGQEVEHKDGF